MYLNVDYYISEPVFILPIDVASSEANVLVLVATLLFFGVQMRRSSFMFVCHGHAVIKNAMREETYTES